jgi:hypothetical protein
MEKRVPETLPFGSTITWLMAIEYFRKYLYNSRNPKKKKVVRRELRPRSNDDIRLDTQK